MVVLPLILLNFNGRGGKRRKQVSIFYWVKEAHLERYDISSREVGRSGGVWTARERGPNEIKKINGRTTIGGGAFFVFAPSVGF